MIRQIIEIESLENGGHRNQRGYIEDIPDGWVEIPPDMEIPSSFPFVDLVFEEGVLLELIAREMPAEEENE